MIYFCVPTHNEEKTVGVVLWKLRHVMAELPRDYQILVGDDASTDGTAQVLDPYRRVLPLVLMRNGTRRGYAATLEMLLRQAVRMSRYPKRDSVVVLQGDFTDDLDAAADLLRRLESGADIAAGGPVADSTKPGFVERLAVGWARRTLARFEWPENADPLNGLTAYRLICVKRAVEESDPNRLLAWDGRTANAALLRSALPHARRIECVEMTRHAERAQRARRFRPLELVMNVRRFAAGNPAAGLTPPDALGPDEVKGDLSVLHGPAGNGAGRAESAAERQPSSRPRHASRDRSPERQRSPRRAGGGQSPEGRTRPDRPPRRRKKAAGAEDAATAPAGAEAAGVAAQATGDTQGDAGAEARQDRPRRRSGAQRRRGGRNRKRAGVSKDEVSVSGDSGGAGPARPGAGEEATEGAGNAAGQNGQDIVAEGNTGQDRKRRRRGRRGGKGRRGGRRGTGTNDAPDTSTEERTTPES